MPHNVNLLAIFSFCLTPGMIGEGGHAPASGWDILNTFVFILHAPAICTGLCRIKWCLFLNFVCCQPFEVPYSMKSHLSCLNHDFLLQFFSLINHALTTNTLMLSF